MEPPQGALFVSPHLDDAVLGCGEVLASTVRAAVVTVFAGHAPPRAPLTDWDRAAGFAPGEDVVAARREEDREAMALLGAAALWLDFLDDQYGGAESPEALAPALAAAIERHAARAVYVPLGLFHADHRRASDAALAVFPRCTEPAWFVYEEPMYRRVAGAREARVDALARRGIRLAPVSLDVSDDARARKAEAIACYRSQLRALGTRSGHADALEPERYWRVAPEAR